MTSIFAKNALLPNGWQKDVFIKIDEFGNIEKITIGKIAKNATDRCEILIPGMINTHSHSFQFAMAGLAEQKQKNKDSFWTWRKNMYEFTQNITSKDMADISTSLYIEMLKSGYTSVGEFHYLHHDINGKNHADIAEMSKIIINSALEVGINITHLPVLYKYSGFGKIPPNSGQIRFVNSNDNFLKIIDELQETYKNNEQVKIGMAYHSLRAVAIEDIKATMKKNTPIHIHIAEQEAEITDCQNYTNKRAVEYLIDNIKIDKNWTLIHATHMTEKETIKLAKTGAVVSICPTTEANLGDGIFPMKIFLKNGGKISIGSDSHISVNMLEELRWLEYVQRLNTKQRCIIDNIYNRNLSGGAQSLAQNTGEIKTGKRADFLVIDENNPHIINKKSELILDNMIFACNNNPIKNVMVAGKWRVIAGNYIKT